MGNKVDIKGSVKRIDALREAAGIPRSDLASAVGIPATTLSNYLTRGGEPTWEVMERIAKYFGVTTGYLRTGATPSKELEEAMTDLADKISLLPADKQDGIVRAFTEIVRLAEV